MSSFRALLVFLLVTAGCVTVKVVYPPPVQQLETPLEKVRRTMMEMRSFGTALEAFAVDNNFFPAMPEARQRVGQVEVLPVVEIVSQLAHYIRVVPANDPWGNPYLYWSSREQYAVISTGSDGKITDTRRLSEILEKLPGSPVVVSQNETKCLEDEIVFAAGQFLVRPSDQVAPCFAK